VRTVFIRGRTGDAIDLRGTNARMERVRRGNGETAAGFTNASNGESPIILTMVECTNRRPFR